MKTKRPIRRKFHHRPADSDNQRYEKQDLFKPDKPAKPAKGFSSPGWIVLNTILIFLFSQFTAAIFVEIILTIVHPHVSSGFFDNSIAAQFFYVLLAESLAVALVLWVVRRRGLRLSAIGLGRRPVWGDLLRAIIGFGAFYLVLIIVGVIIGIVSPNINNEQQNIGFNNLHTTSDNTLAFLALVILPPLGEETLVRGYLYSGLRKYWRFLPALLLTSAIFGIAHLEIGSGSPLVWGAAIDTFILSVVLVYMREKTGALYAGILVHMLNNLVAFTVHYHS
ncbi:MAG TPA: type II CAAX endopeptidase family protein [Candidatus Saccharimonadales bacterium]|nr:type II CAAX endopeptidase family protein [Candidatus Saccharimonadales bacterium]